MKYYSELTKKTYDTVEELEKEEAVKKAEKEKKDAYAEQRKKDAQIVREKMNAYEKAYEEYDKAISDFVKKYGSYHATITGSGVPSISKFVDSVVDNFFDRYFL